MSRQTLRSQSRRMVFDVFTFFSRELSSITECQKRTAEATNVSVATIKKILREVKEADHLAAFKTPGKKRKRQKPVTGIDDFDKGVIRRCIHNFHLAEEKLPTIDKLRAKLSSDINFKGSEKSFRSIVKELGFKWKATGNNTKFLIETSGIRYLRIKYLQQLKYYREQGRPIIYSGESCVYPYQTHLKFCPEASKKGAKKPISKGQRVVVVHAGSDTGFVPNALYTFKSETKNGAFDGDLMTYANYAKWIRGHLLPNLPPNSIIVIDNSKYHNHESDLAPNSDSKKSDMQAWLTEKQIEFDPNMLKPELYHLIKTNKERFKEYSVDKLFAQHGHTVLRLPPNHSDLNPLEMVWAAIKGYIRSKDVGWNMATVMQLVQAKVDAIGPYDWKNQCDEVIAIEDAYIKSDHVVDEMTDECVVRIEDSTDEENISVNSNSDSEDSESDTEAGPSVAPARNRGFYMEPVIEITEMERQQQQQSQ